MENKTCIEAVLDAFTTLLENVKQDKYGEQYLTKLEIVSNHVVCCFNIPTLDFSPYSFQSFCFRLEYTVKEDQFSKFFTDLEVSPYAESHVITAEQYEKHKQLRKLSQALNSATRESLWLLLNPTRYSKLNQRRLNMLKHSE